MYKLASILGIDSHRYAATLKTNNEENKNFIEDKASNFTIYTKEGLTITCPDCNKETKINRVNNKDKMQTLVKCANVSLCLLYLLVP